ncbi:MAG: hypothetical protein E7620_04440 [Ruminococcaceae bacterium]|nr:hypothetical protein [Oscillospiraceae bacterium]
MKRIVGLLIAMATLLGVVGVFGGCEKTPSVEEPPKGQEPAEQVAIIEGGVSRYVILYPEVPTATETEVVQLLRTKIQSVTNVRLKAISEEFKNEEPDAKIIYVGNTTFAPAKEAREQMMRDKFDSYVIDISNGDIYIAGASEEALYNAVKYYTDSLVEDNYDSATKTLYFEGSRYNGTKVFPTGFSAKHIREYSIIYPASGLSMLRIAKSLQAEILDRTGYTVDIYKDTEREAGQFEILIGETNRPFSGRCYADSSRLMTYEYLVEGCQLQLAFGGYYSGRKSVENFGFRMLRDEEKYFTSGSHHAEDFAKTEKELTAGADVRIMSANILAYRWGEEDYDNVLPAAERAEIFAGVLLRYSPDAVGMQETDEPWQQVLPWYLERIREKDGVEYTFLLEKLTHEGKTMINFSTILYRSDLYSVDVSGYEVFSIWSKTPKYFQRVATYVKLTGKTDPQKEFVLVNTHWAHEDDETVNACAVEQAALVNQLKRRYEGVTVFCTGDYNNLPNREWGDQYLNKLVSEINGRIASSVARDKGVLLTPGGCRGNVKKMDESVMRAVDDHFIDHILLSGGACDVLCHDTIRSNMTHVMSDHSLIYADIVLQ